jgi:hypothetical protein
MKKLNKKTEAVVAALALCRVAFFAILNFGIWMNVGAQTWKFNGTTFSLKNETLRVSKKGPIGGECYVVCEKYPAITDLVIEDGVTSIGEKAFRPCSSLTSVTISGSVVSIGERAFYRCKKLKTVVIQNGVKSIGEKAFSQCTGLTSVTIPGSVTSIGDMAFGMDGRPCPGLVSITIPEGVKSIGRYALGGCIGLLSVTIPGSVTSLGQEVFIGCTGLTSINVNINNSTYISVEGVLLNKTKDTLITYPIAKKGNTYTIPNSVKTIGAAAFEGCTGLMSVDIPNSVNIIENYAFVGCISLSSLVIPSGVKSIESGTFLGCAKLTSVEIPNSVTNIESKAFYECIGLKSITIPNSVTYIGSGAFDECSNLASVTSLNPVPPTLKELPFGVEPRLANMILYVPAFSLLAYRLDHEWGKFGKIKPK